MSKPPNVVAQQQVMQQQMMPLSDDMIGAIKIKDGLFIGDEFAAQDLEFVVANKVTHVINCSGRQIPNHWEPIGVTYLTYYWMDQDNQIVLDSKDQTAKEIFNFIEEALLKTESVLVHSVRGQSRSSTIIAAYMMRRYQWSLLKTLEFLNSRRPDLEIRASFIQQLSAYENRLVKQGIGPKTSKWTEISEVNPTIESEELLLRNTFLNAQMGPLAEFQQDGLIQQALLRWTDEASNNKQSLTVDEFERDLVNQQQVQKITVHRRVQPSKLKPSLRKVQNSTNANAPQGSGYQQNEPAGVNFYGTSEELQQKSEDITDLDNDIIMNQQNNVPVNLMQPNNLDKLNNFAQKDDGKFQVSSIVPNRIENTGYVQYQQTYQPSIQMNPKVATRPTIPGKSALNAQPMNQPRIGQPYQVTKKQQIQQQQQQRPSNIPKKDPKRKEEVRTSQDRNKKGESPATRASTGKPQIGFQSSVVGKSTGGGMAQSYSSSINAKQFTGVTGQNNYSIGIGSQMYKGASNSAPKVGSQNTAIAGVGQFGKNAMSSFRSGPVRATAINENKNRPYSASTTGKPAGTTQTTAATSATNKYGRPSTAPHRPSSPGSKIPMNNTVPSSDQKGQSPYNVYQNSLKQSKQSHLEQAAAAQPINKAMKGRMRSASPGQGTVQVKGVIAQNVAQPRGYSPQKPKWKT